MEEFILCLTKLKKRYKTKHVQSTKHKNFFPNLIINKYLVKKDEIGKFKDILQSFCDEHKKKFIEFTLCNIWKKNGLVINKISVPYTITLLQTHPFKPVMEGISIYVEVSFEVSRYS